MLQYRLVRKFSWREKIFFNAFQPPSSHVVDRRKQRHGSGRGRDWPLWRCSRLRWPLGSAGSRRGVAPHIEGALPWDVGAATGQAHHGEEGRARTWARHRPDFNKRLYLVICHAVGQGVLLLAARAPHRVLGRHQGASRSTRMSPPWSMASATKPMKSETRALESLIAPSINRKKLQAAHRNLCYRRANCLWSKRLSRASYMPGSEASWPSNSST